MSNRKNEFKSTGSNPASKFLEWKSDQKTFSYYDKEKGENVSLPLPLKFITLKEMHTVKGWDDASQSGIYSNEVQYISKTPLNVKSFKGGLIASGLYKDIKSAVQSKGGHYLKSIYAMLENGDLVNFQLKGSAVQAWGDFTQKAASRLPEEWVIVKSAVNKTKGKVNYSVPSFEFFSSLDKDSSTKADAAYDNLEEYLSGYDKVVEEVVATEEELGF